jgi:putative transposase
MYYVLKPDFMGRDRFIELMMSLGFRVQHKKNYKRTTYTIANNYPNLIKGYRVNQSSTIWQSDITYYSIGDKFYYAVFIIDVYSKVIVGHKVSDNMRATANIEALQMALSSYKAPKIHHSDRGSQYIYKEYIQILKDQGTSISMALSAQDNAYAERINKTIKEEYLDYWKPKSLQELIKRVDQAVENYNQKRIHKHLNRMTPQKFYKLCQTKEFKRPIIEIYNHESG